MKKDTHPASFRQVVFVDNASGIQFLLWSTVETNEKSIYNGTEYPLYRVEISSASHPFYTGEKNSIDSAGRVEKFKTRASKKTS